MPAARKPAYKLAISQKDWLGCAKVTATRNDEPVTSETYELRSYQPPYETGCEIVIRGYKDGEWVEREFVYDGEVAVGDSMREVRTHMLQYLREHDIK